MNILIAIGTIAAFGYSMLVALTPSAIPEKCSRHDTFAAELSLADPVHTPASESTPEAPARSAEHTERDLGRFEST
ncbi:MAG: hypothetical protein ACPGVG_17510 [Mycobacterium sp.]